MLHLVLALLAPLLYLWVLWYLYVLTIGFYRAHLDKKLTGFAFALALPALIVGYAVDLAANWTIASLWFQETPVGWKELVTDRLSRYINGPPGWRHRHASWLCSNLLDYFDPDGRHCK